MDGWMADRMDLFDPVSEHNKTKNESRALISSAVFLSSHFWFCWEREIAGIGGQSSRVSWVQFVQLERMVGFYHGDFFLLLTLWLVWLSSQVSLTVWVSCTISRNLQTVDHEKLRCSIDVVFPISNFLSLSPLYFCSAFCWLQLLLFFFLSFFPYQQSVSFALPPFGAVK